MIYRIGAGSEEDLGAGLGTGLFSQSEHAGWCMEECAHTLHLNIEWCSGRAYCKCNVCLRESPPKRSKPRFKPVCRFTVRERAMKITALIRPPPFFPGCLSRSSSLSHHRPQLVSPSHARSLTQHSFQLVSKPRNPLVSMVSQYGMSTVSRLPKALPNFLALYIGKPRMLGLL